MNLEIRGSKSASLSNPYFLLIVFVFLFLAHRIAVLWISPLSFFWYEDFYQGTIAKEILNGSRFPLWDWQAAAHEGGTLWIGLAAVPLFKIFGPTYFSLKLVPILFSLISMILIYCFLSRHFSNRAANISAGLMILSAPGYLKLRMLAVGTHASASFLWISALWCFYEAMQSAPRTARLRFFLTATGLFIGLGVGYAYILGIGMAVILLSWFFWNSRSLFSKDFFYFLTSFAIGYSPTLFYNAAHDWDGFRWLFEWIYFHQNELTGIGFLKKICFLTFWGIPLSFSFEDTSKISWVLMTAPYGIMIIAAYFLGCWKWIRSKKVIPLLAYPLLFMSVYALSPWYSNDAQSSFFSFRYYAPLQGMLLIGAAIGLAAISKSRFRHAWLGGILLLAVLGQILMIIRNQDWRNPAGMRGYSYWPISASWGTPFPEKYDDFIERTQKIDEKYYPRIYEGYFRLDSNPTLKEKYTPELTAQLIGEIKKEKSLRRLYLSKLLGRYAVYHKGFDMDQFRLLTQNLTEQEKSHFYARAFKEITPTDLNSMPWDKIRAVSPAADWLSFSLGYNFQASADWPEIRLRVPSAAWAYRGTGKFKGERWHRGWMTFRNKPLVSDKIPERFKEDFFWGFGWGMANYFPFKEEASNMQVLLKKRGVEPGLIEKAVEGFESYRKWQKGLIAHPV